MWTGNTYLQIPQIPDHKITEIVVINSDAPYNENVVAKYERKERERGVLYVLQTPNDECEVRIAVQWDDSFTGADWIKLTSAISGFTYLKELKKGRHKLNKKDLEKIAFIQQMINGYESGYSSPRSKAPTPKPVIGTRKKEDEEGPFKKIDMTTYNDKKEDGVIYVMEAEDSIYLTKEWSDDENHDAIYKVEDIRGFLKTDKTKYTCPSDLNHKVCHAFLDKKLNESRAANEAPSIITPDVQLTSEEEKKINGFFGKDFVNALHKLDSIFSLQPALMTGRKEFRTLITKLKETDFEEDLSEIKATIDQLIESAKLSGWPLFKYWAWRLGVAFAAAAPTAYCGATLGGTVGAMAGAALGGGVLSVTAATVGFAIGSAAGGALGLLGFWGGYETGKAISQRDPQIAIADHAATLRNAVRRKM